MLLRVSPLLTDVYSVKWDTVNVKAALSAKMFRAIKTRRFLKAV
jgi:hypothetical protein